MKKISMILLVVLILNVLLNARPGMSSEYAADFSTPKKTFLTFLRTVKQNDLEAAKACWHFSGDTSEAILDILVGMFVVHHQFNALVIAKFQKEGTRFVRGDCTDAAIDRTIERVADSASAVTMSRDRAELLITWQEDDGYPVEVFWYDPGKPIVFRSVNKKWKLDMHVMGDLTGEESLAMFDDPCGIGGLMSFEKLLREALIQELEADRISTPEELVQAWKQKAKELAQSFDCEE